MKEVKESLKLNIKQKKGKGVFRLIQFEDNGHFIAYIPSLNLSGYGDTEEEAINMLGDIVFEDFFENLFEQPENVIFEHLKKFGWTKGAFFTKDLSNNVHIDKEGILKNFNLSSETKITEKLVTV